MIFETLTNRSPIEKGWSGDQKYRAEDAEGGVYLLRVSPPERLERRREAVGRMEQAFALGVAMPRPVEWGACPEGVYTLEEWIDGDDAEELIPTLAPERQYAYGLEAGRILSVLHTLSAPAGAEDWETRFNRKLDRNLARYAACPLKYEVDAPILDFIAAHRHLLHGRPQTWQHGDYHIGKLFARLNERLMHRFYRRHILTYYRFKRSFSFVYVADYSSEYSYIGVGVDIYFYIHKVTQARLGKDKYSVYNQHRRRLYPACFVASVMNHIVVNGAFYRFSAFKLRYML